MHCRDVYNEIIGRQVYRTFFKFFVSLYLDNIEGILGFETVIIAFLKSLDDMSAFIMVLCNKPLVGAS